jgi:hypothetical protein
VFRPTKWPSSGAENKKVLHKKNRTKLQKYKYKNISEPTKRCNKQQRVFVTVVVEPLSTRVAPLYHHNSFNSLNNFVFYRLA